MKYSIKERWYIMGQVETHEDERESFEDIKLYIQNWIEGWLDSANEHDYEIRTFIRQDWRYATVSFPKVKDRMILKVEEKE